MEKPEALTLNSDYHNVANMAKNDRHTYDHHQKLWFENSTQMLVLCKQITNEQKNEKRKIRGLLCED